MKQMTTLLLTGLLALSGAAFLTATDGGTLEYRSSANRGGFGNFIKKRIPGNKKGANLSDQDIARGLKEALKRGVTLAVRRPASRGGFYNNRALRIPFPPEARKIEQRLRRMPGMRRKIDEFVRKMNEGAEDAAKEAVRIFANAITSMSVRDARNILFGNETAATDYFKRRMTGDLKRAFGPPIRRALQAVGAIDTWRTLARAYNRLPMTRRINTDIVAYTTDMALDRIFRKIAEAERDIRKRPAARVSQILKKVFGAL